MEEVRSGQSLSVIMSQVKRVSFSLDLKAVSEKLSSTVLASEFRQQVPSYESLVPCPLSWKVMPAMEH